MVGLWSCPLLSLENASGGPSPKLRPEENVLMDFGKPKSVSIREAGCMVLQCSSLEWWPDPYKKNLHSKIIQKPGKPEALRLPWLIQVVAMDSWRLISWSLPVVLLAGAGGSGSSSRHAARAKVHGFSESLHFQMGLSWKWKIDDYGGLYYPIYWGSS